MAVLADESDMKSGDNVHKNESCHESNVYFDRQLQNKLLQVDEDSDNEVYESKLSKSWGNLKTGGKLKSDPKEEINGWFPSSKFVGRKNDLPKTEQKPTTNNFIHPWKDYRNKKEENFVFKHYTEFRKYMEQYRNQHGCHINRFPSGNQMGEMRRTAFQNSAPPQQTQVTVQQLHQSGYTNSAPPSSCTNGHHSSVHYTTRKEHLGTLMTPTSNCTCNNPKTNGIDNSSQSQRYKVTTGQLSRTNTSYELRHENSDNSSECGESRFRTPSRRTNSASSSRSRTITGKTPTKITVPANPSSRAYPVQALTIQQNGKTEVCHSPKPLDNLNCVAPEKQPANIERKTVNRNLELALKVHSLNDLLTTTEAPLRGYALPKSMPPNPNANNGEGSEFSDTDSDDCVSLDQLSTCPLSADLKHRKKHDSQSHHLQRFLKEDPMLSSLNQRPEIRPGTSERQNLSAATQLFNSDSFIIPKNDVDAMLRVNMWNPILSMPPNGPRRDLASQQYKSLMTQIPFRVVDERGKPQSSIDSEVRTSYPEQIDYFNPMKKVRLSITRLDNAVSFCRTQVHSGKKEAGDKRSMSRASNSTQNGKGETNGDQVSFKMKPPIFDPFAGKLKKPTKFEQKFNIPVPPVKILESIPLEKIVRKTGSAGTQCYLESISPRSSTAQKSRISGNKQNDPSGNYLPDINASNNQQIDNSAQDNIVEKNPQVELNQSAVERGEKTGQILEKSEEIKVSVTKDKNSLENGKDKVNADETKDKEAAENGSPKKEESKKEALEGLMGTKINMDNRKNDKPSNTSLSAKKLLKKPSVASGGTSNECYVGPFPEKLWDCSASHSVDNYCIRSADAKCLKSHPELDGLTWAEKLEVLRSVNKKRDKPKTKQRKLKYVKADPKDPLYMWSFDQDRLYEQRRIKHLVEQARIKGGKQFDWVYEAQIKSLQEIDWDTIDKCSENDGAASGHSTDDDDEGATGDSNLGKYGIHVPSKQVKGRLFNMHKVNRSKTYIAP